MKTFKDLNLIEHTLSELSDRYKDHKMAFEVFENGYAVSVLFGKSFYSNGIDTYELAILLNGDLCYTSGITDGVLEELSEEEVSDIMIRVASLQSVE